MKTADLIQMGALVVVGYLAYQKFAGAKTPPSSKPAGAAPSIPSTVPVSAPIQTDWGVDTSGGWDSASAPSAANWVAFLDSL